MIILLLSKMELRPDDWFRGGYQAVLERVRIQVAELIDADLDRGHIVFVENASTAVNAVARSVLNSPDDKVFILSTAYPMVKNTLNFLREKGRCSIIECPISFPIVSEASVLHSIETFFRDNREACKGIKLAIVSHIVSLPGVILPIAEIAKTLKQHGVAIVMADAAHTLGQIPIHIRSLDRCGVDLYVTNAHKWLYAPKGSAVFWLSSRVSSQIAPHIISSEYAKSASCPHGSAETCTNDQFVYTGTRDYTAYCAIGDAIAFRQQLGERRIQSYCHALAVWAAHYFCDQFQTRSICPDSMIGAMLNVELPVDKDDTTVHTDLLNHMLKVYDTTTVVFRLPDGSCWTRLSAQIYMDRYDFVRACHRMRSFLQHRYAGTSAALS